MSVRDRLRALRERRGWTQNHLAEVSGIPQPTIWRVEKGIIKNPTAQVLKRLAQALEVSADYLLREDENDQGVSFDEILLRDPVGQAVFRGYDQLTTSGKDQVMSFVRWLAEQERKEGEQP